MLEGEVFPKEARVGLWDGRIYEKMAKTQAHAIAGNKVNLDAGPHPAGGLVRRGERTRLP